MYLQYCNRSSRNRSTSDMQSASVPTNFPRVSGPSSCPPCAHFNHVFSVIPPLYKHTVCTHRMTSFLSRRCCIKSPVAPAALHCRNSVSVSLSVIRVWFASKPAHRRANIYTRTVRCYLQYEAGGRPFCRQYCAELYSSGL